MMRRNHLLIFNYLGNVSWTKPYLILLQPIIIQWNVFTIALVPVSQRNLASLWSEAWKWFFHGNGGHFSQLVLFKSTFGIVAHGSGWSWRFLHVKQTENPPQITEYEVFYGINVSERFLFVSNIHQCFFNLGLKRRVCSALSTTLGRWMGFLCSRSRLLVDPICVCFFGALWLAQPGTAFCSPPSMTRGTRNTQLEWRPCWAEVEATVGEESRDFC